MREGQELARSRNSRLDFLFPPGLGAAIEDPGPNRKCVLFSAKIDFDFEFPFDIVAHIVYRKSVI